MHISWLLRLTALWVCLIGLAGCGHTIINKPIALHKAGSVVEAKFTIPREKDRIYLRLEFLVSDHPGDRDRLYKFLGKMGYVDVGTPTPVKVKIIKCTPTKNEIFLEKNYLLSSTNAFGSNFFERTITELSIPQGKYLVRLETLADFPQLSNTPVNFLLGYIRAPK